MTDLCNPRTLLESRAHDIDYSSIEQLYYLGNYTRRLPVSLIRMIENAHDWEHLPFVHSSRFSHIELLQQGDWGWRAEVASASSGGEDKSVLELLVDNEKHYWATTVISGPGAGVQIHTQASAVADQLIDIDVRFYFPKPLSWLRKVLSLFYLKRQYRRLYDEDLALMRDRQAAIENKTQWRQVEPLASNLLLVGEIAQLNPDQVQVVESSVGRYCVAYHAEQWHAYSAVCPHKLGKLEESKVDSLGRVSCPWHAYQFDISSGRNIDNRCTDLPIFDTQLDGQKLYINLATK